jgi:hypothetical protein
VIGVAIMRKEAINLKTLDIKLKCGGLNKFIVIKRDDVETDSMNDIKA